VIIFGSSSTITVTKAPAGATFTASGAKDAVFVVTYPI
jgi:hypothetical protein